MPDVVMTFKGRPYNLTEEPMIIGILNHTPDSFYAGSRIEGERNIHQRIEEIIAQGGKMIDVGGTALGLMLRRSLRRRSGDG